jgi:hypothetical protein
MGEVCGAWIGNSERGEVMKPICEANCGKRTQVYGNKYCPECHRKYAHAWLNIQFCPASEKPRLRDEHRTFLLLNQCSGYIIAEAYFLDGEFWYFETEGKNSPCDEKKGDYCAWAVLPDELKSLHPVFAKDVK